MAYKLYNEESVQDIANALREKLEVEDTFTIGEMAEAVRAIEGGEDVTDETNLQVELLNTLEDVVNEFPSKEGDGWQPDKDMKWAKKVCEDDVQEGFTYKVLQMISDGYSYTDIKVPAGGAVKTSDGGYYTSNTKHFWDDSQARHSAVGDYKTRWLIYYSNIEAIGTSISLLEEAMYACFDGVKFGGIFKNKGKLQYFDVINDAGINITSTSQMFNYCYSLQSIPLLNTSNVTNMSQMFYYCYSLQTIPLLDTSNVTNMNNMFRYCRALSTIPLLNTNKVTNMSTMFSQCYSLQSIPLLDTSKVTDMNTMFSECTSLSTIPLLDTSKVTNMSTMFNKCNSLQAIPLLDTSSVTNMGSMFNACSALQIIPALDTSRVTNVAQMINSCSLLKTVISLDLGNVTSANNQSYMTSSSGNLEFLTLKNIKWNLDISNSTKYSRETLVDILNNLVDLSGGTAQKLTMGSTNLAKLTNEDKLIATNKNWTLA